MSLKTRYFSFIIILHLILSILLYLLFEEKKYLFLISEIGILISFYLGYLLYKIIIYPSIIIESGKSAIQDEDFTIKYIGTGTKEMDELIDVYNGMIDRLRDEKTKTEEQSYFLENLIDSSPFGMIIMDYDQKIDFANVRVREFLDCKELRGKTLDEINSVLSREISSLSPFEDKIVTIDSLKKYKCKIHQVIHKGFPRQFVMIEELTADILKAEKAAYGKVIRMMAHEVNNSMGAVNSILESVHQYGFSDSEEHKELKHYLEIAIDRNKMLGKFSDNFAKVIRLPEPLISEIDLNIIVKKSADYFTLMAKEKEIEIQCDLAQNKVMILADQLQLEQVFSNIIKNAIESIESNGKITIETNSNPSSLRFSDDGNGIKSDDSEKLFTPFYSTKPTGQGIGLMLIRDILNNHNAEYKLFTDSESGLTHFDIEF